MCALDKRKNEQKGNIEDTPVQGMGKSAGEMVQLSARPLRESNKNFNQLSRQKSVRK